MSLACLSVSCVWKSDRNYVLNEAKSRQEGQLVRDRTNHNRLYTNVFAENHIP